MFIICCSNHFVLSYSIDKSSIHKNKSFQYIYISSNRCTHYHLEIIKIVHSFIIRNGNGVDTGMIMTNRLIYKSYIHHYQNHHRSWLYQNWLSYHEYYYPGYYQGWYCCCCYWQIIQSHAIYLSGWIYCTILYFFEFLGQLQ